MIRDYAKLFVGGFLWDAVITLDVLFTAEKRYLAVAATTFAITVISATVYEKVLKRDGLDRKRLIALATGSGIGAALMVRFF
jgi:hypothetical protein